MGLINFREVFGVARKENTKKKSNIELKMWYSKNVASYVICLGRIES